VFAATDTTAIAAIVFAAAVVVIVIAVAVANPRGRTTLAGAATAVITRVDTLAFRAVNPLTFVTRCATAITTVPTTTTVVVVVITAAILLELGLCTLATALGLGRFFGRWCSRGLWILAFTFRAVGILPLTTLGSAAITSVPLASAVVVVIIAIAITHIRRTAAFAVTILDRSGRGSGGRLGGKRWIQALATGLFVAVRVLVLIS